MKRFVPILHTTFQGQNLILSSSGFDSEEVARSWIAAMVILLRRNCTGWQLQDMSLWGKEKNSESLVIDSEFNLDA